MASQWIRWNNVSHIFEYSTDNGTSFGPLPLNASILTEGSLNPAFLPANTAKVDANNVFTAAIPVSIESAAPIIQLKETDQAVDARYWREVLEASVFKLQSLTDALVPTTLFSLSRAGQFVIPSVADHLFGGTGGSGQNVVRSRSNAAGASVFAEFALDTEVLRQGRIIALSGSWTSSGVFTAGGLVVVCGGVGPLNLAASDASGGAINFFTGGVTTPRATISVGGLTTINDKVTIVRTTDSGTLNLRKSNPSTSGQPEGGIIFEGQGIAHSAMWYIPANGGQGQIVVGFGGNGTDAASHTVRHRLGDAILLAVNGTYDIPGGARMGVLVITETADNTAAIFVLRGGTGATLELLDPTNNFSNTAGTANMCNIFWNAATTSYRIQNLRTGTISIVCAILAIQ